MIHRNSHNSQAVPHPQIHQDRVVLRRRRRAVPAKQGSPLRSQRAVRTGLDVLEGEGFRRLRRANVGLLAHPASVDADLSHAATIFHRTKALKLLRLFGPQHGLRGETQDNMVEWKGFTDPETGVPVYSLYGKHRKPTREMLKGLDVLVIDLQDAGARPYTFIWTTLLCMEACAELGVKVLVLDRPNPIGALRREGPVLNMKYKSFVGMARIPLRHGLTAGELSMLCNRTLEIAADLEVVRMRGFRRSMLFGDTGLPWVMPSPNLPTTTSATVYPGFVLLEGTNLSEGRGTTRPFEIIGAPFVDAQALVRRLSTRKLPGVVFRPIHFQPTFQKWSGKLCAGVQVHVINSHVFRPCLTAVTVLAAIKELWPGKFKWKQPPYEYEDRKLPIDILAGGPGIREGVDSGKSPDDIVRTWEQGLSRFNREVLKYLLYE